jgi:hypothetical protein
MPATPAISPLLMNKNLFLTRGINHVLFVRGLNTPPGRADFIESRLLIGPLSRPIPPPYTEGLNSVSVSNTRLMDPFTFTTLTYLIERDVGDGN